MRKCVFLFILLTTIMSRVCAQSSPFVFTHFTEKNGLSANFVNCLLKDTRGFLWVGTLDGLNCFDGAHFFTFRNGHQAGSLPNNTVHDICEDPQGNIWGGTDNGIFCFEPQRQQFKKYTIPDSRAGNNIFNIICDRDGDIWATGYWFVFRLDKAKDQFVKAEQPSPDPAAADQFNIRKNGLLAGKDGKGIWLATRSGLLYYDKQQRRYLDYRNQPGHPLFMQHSVSALTAAPDSSFWCFDNTTSECIQFDPQSQQIRQKIAVQGAIPHASGASIFISRDQKLWFSTWNYKLLVVDLAHGNTIQPLHHDEKNVLSIAADFFWAAAEDEDGTLWLGTSGGLSLCNTSNALYRDYRIPYFTTKAAPDERIISFNEHPADGSWWLGTTAHKLIQYFPATGQYTAFDLAQALPNPKGELPSFFYKIRFYFNRIIICFYNGLWEYTPGSNRIRPLSVLPDTLKNAAVKDILAISDSVYLLTDTKYLFEWHTRTGEVVVNHLPEPKGETAGTGGFSLADYQPGQPVWTSIGFGVVGYYKNRQLNPVQLYTNSAEEQNGFINDFTTDKWGRTWFAVTGSGLYAYDLRKKEVRHWTSADGLVNNHIQTTITDSFGQIWCSSFNKVSVFFPGANTFYNFSLPVSENNLNYSNWGMRLANGQLLISMMNDLILFNPAKLFTRPFIKKPVISSVTISGKQLLLSGQSSLQLEPDENSLHFRFGLLTDKATFPYALRYKLEGFDASWTDAGAGNEAVYNHLPPGKYRFRLMAYARNKAWQSEEKILEIIIRTPFYKSAWFYIAAGLLVLMSLFLFYRMRMNHQRRILTLETKAASLEKEKTIVQYESLKQQLNPHFLFNSLTSLRSLIKTDAKTAAGFLDGMSKVYRYVLKSGEQELARLQDELDFVKTYTELQQIRFNEGLVVQLRVPESAYNKYIVPVTLQNLVENAIKHNTADRESPLQIEIYTEGEFVVVKNNLQRYRIVETSNRKGLSNLKTLYTYYSDTPVEIAEDAGFFTVKIPLI